MGVLSKTGILRNLKSGHIVIEPFEERNLANSSYDVRLGEYFYRQRVLDHTQTLNPFWQKSIESFYSEPMQGVTVKEIRSERNPFYNLADSQKLIMLAPNETILAHTVEFIGGRNGDVKKGVAAVTTEMRARSSVGRLGIAVCKCAGWGDIGYINRWTMEITNFSTCIVPLPVGMRIAQIIFHEVEPVEEKAQYETKGKYQGVTSISELKKKWQPSDMLPKLYKDWDLPDYQTFAKKIR